MLILLRHGRTAANANGLLQGRIDLDLDDVGAAQAAASVGAIGPVDRIIASPLGRAQQTAAAFGQAIETDERFIELDYGTWEGKPVREVPAEVWRQWRDDLDFRPPGGETLRELGQRVRAGLTDLAAQAADQNVLVVSHVSPIKAAVAWALGVTDETTWRLTLDQASITRVSFVGAVPRLAGFNATSHLVALG